MVPDNSSCSASAARRRLLTELVGEYRDKVAAKTIQEIPGPTPGPSTKSDVEKLEALELKVEEMRKKSHLVMERIVDPVPENAPLGRKQNKRDIKMETILPDGEGRGEGRDGEGRGAEGCVGGGEGGGGGVGGSTKPEEYPRSWLDWRERR